MDDKITKLIDVKLGGRLMKGFVIAWILLIVGIVCWGEAIQ